MTGQLQRSTEDGNISPAYSCIWNALQVIWEIHEISPQFCETYVTEDGGMVVDVGATGRSIVVTCYPDNRIQYLMQINGEQIQSVHHNGTMTIPLDLLRSALTKLETGDVLK